MAMPLYQYQSPTRRTDAERQEILANTAPKIVDEKKYYGPAVTDFSAIKKRMDELAS